MAKARRGDHTLGKRSLLLTPRQLEVIRAAMSGRIKALTEADKEPESIRKEITALLPVYRSIIHSIDELATR